MRKGRYNVELPQCYGNLIKKFNTYINDACTRFIYFEGEYTPIIRKERYKGGWLWQLKYYSNKVGEK